MFSNQSINHWKSLEFWLGNILEERKYPAGEKYLPTYVPTYLLFLEYNVFVGNVMYGCGIYPQATLYYSTIELQYLPCCTPPYVKVDSIWYGSI